MCHPRARLAARIRDRLRSHPRLHSLGWLARRHNVTIREVVGALHQLRDQGEPLVWGCEGARWTNTLP